MATGSLAILGETNPPSREVIAAYVEFLELLEDHKAPPVGEFVASHPECDREELLLYLEAIVQIDGISPSQMGAGQFERAEDDPEFVDPRYRVEGVIGRGGMGVVFCVFDRDMERRVAMKVVRRFPAAINERMQQLFMEEVMTSAKLEHPSIVPLHEWGMTTDERLYYTMRWVKGRTLAQVISDLDGGDPTATRTFGRIRMLQIFYQLAQGVAYAHDLGIAHQDLKPANVMIGEFGEVMTLDWGLARRFGSTARVGDGEDESIVGTPGYMAPEQITRQPVDPRADVFSLGAILYECLTFRRAFPQTKDSGEVLQQTLLGRFINPREHRAAVDLSDDLLDILGRALSARQEDRQANARVLAEEVFAVFEGARESERRRALAGIEVARGLELARAYRRLRARLDRWSERLAQERLQVMPHWQLEQKTAIWDRQMRLESLEPGVAERFTRAVSAFQGALGLDPGHREARKQLAALYWEEFLVAEARGDLRAAALHREEVKRLDDGTLTAAITGDGTLRLRVKAPRDAAVSVREVRDDGPILVEAGICLQGQGSLAFEQRMPMGRYQVVVSRPRRQNVRFPFRIRRLGEVEISLVHEERPDDDEMIFIPGGQYDLGGDPHISDAPLHRVILDDFSIGKHPVTCERYLEFLNALHTVAPATASIRVPRVASGRPLWERGGADRLYRLPERPVFPYYFESESPVVAISWMDAQAYCEWRSEMDPLRRRFSLPSSDEWEAAARSADGRSFPWGDRYDPCLANNRDSHKGMSRIMNVNEFPTDLSPFGVRGMAGNTSDWCQDYGERGNRQLRIVRGGNASSAEPEARLARAQLRRPDDVGPLVGFRLRATVRTIEKPSSHARDFARARD